MEKNYVKSAKCERLVAGGEHLSLGMNRVKDGKYYKLSARLDGALSGEAKILVCHGYKTSYGRWIEITEKEIKICSFTAWANPQYREFPYEHGLDIKNFIDLDVTFDTANKEKKIVLITEDGEFSFGAGHFSCCDGEIEVFTEGIDLYDVFLGFGANGYSHEIWIIGASYLSLGDPARWPYYWYLEGGAGPLLVGRGGMGAQHGIEDFKDAIKYGKPKILVWDSVSGNNPDREGVLNPLFYDNTLEMIKICKDLGIKVYIQTMPNCPIQTNLYKNDVILNRKDEFANYPYGIIDLARVLDAREEENPAWFTGMLCGDNVHPAKLGARASYLGIVCDCPELMLGKNADVELAEAEKLSEGEKLTLKYSEVKTQSAITFRADFSGELSGKITIGSENGSAVKIDKDNISVFAKDGNILFETENPAVCEKVITLKIKISDNVAEIVLASAGEKNFDAAKATLDVIGAEWTTSGELFASSEGVELSDAKLRFSHFDFISLIIPPLESS